MKRGVIVNKKIICICMLVALGSTVLLSACGDGNNNTSDISNPEINAVNSSEIKTVNNPEVKTVENLEYTLSGKKYNNSGKPENYERTGVYSGEVIDGIPNGHGEFKTQNPQGITWVYKGEFKDGTFNGSGSATWESDDYVNENGTYTDGLFTPTDVEFYSTVQNIYQNSGDVIPAAATFIAEYPNLFPCASKEDKVLTSELTDNTITYEKLIKNITQFGDKLFSAKGLTVQQIFETNAYGRNLTWILAFDQDLHFFVIYYDGSIDIYQGDQINIIALPINYSSFDNTGGGATLFVALAGSVIEKV